MWWPAASIATETPRRQRATICGMYIGRMDEVRRTPLATAIAMCGELVIVVHTTLQTLYMVNHLPFIVVHASSHLPFFLLQVVTLYLVYLKIHFFAHT